MSKKSVKIVVAISGGVDSSVSAFLLQKKGYEVIGVYMRLKQEDGEAERAARAVAKKLGIKFYPVNLMSKFKKEVIAYFLESYKKGLTPNPCVKCNRLIKFGELLRIRKEMGADFLATGHYIGKQIIDNRRQIADKPSTALRAKRQRKIRLFRAKDNTKDQSYFLYHLTQDKLKHILFPLGEFKKSDVRKIADKEKLPYLVSESQDICFLPGEHNKYLKDKLVLKAGLIAEAEPLRLASLKRRGLASSKVIGKHNGLPLYTIGQRRGVEIGGTGPYYVVRRDYKTNILHVTKDRDDKELYTKEFIAKNINWISGKKLEKSLKCEAVIRYRHKGVECQIQNAKCKIQNVDLGINEVKVVLGKAQRAVTPGQSVVFYKGDELLGGGIIG